MRWLFRILWLLLVVGLFALALLPYTQTLHQTYQNFIRAWANTLKQPVLKIQPAPELETRPQLTLPQKKLTG